ncbi:MAG: MipA/OmpV family protein [Sulfitobacter sp.]
MRYLPLTVLSVALLGSTAFTAAAQDRYFNFALRGGISAAPSYPGSDSYSVGPDLAFKFGALKLGSIDAGNGIGEIPDNGFSYGGAFRVIGDRKVKDNPELAGLDDIDYAVELGIGVTYRETNWLAFGELRKAFGGSHGVTGTLGADMIFRPDDRWTISAGPRINLGDTDYAQTYYGVPGSSTSSFAPFNPGGGVLGAGFEVQATYELNNNWALEGAITYQKLLNDAADSPITMSTTGSDDQLSLRLGLSRAFTLRF